MDLTRIRQPRRIRGSRRFRARAMLLFYPGSVALLLMPGTAVAQRPELGIPRLTQPPQIERFLALAPDQKLDTPMVRVTDFIQREPVDGAPATQETDVYLGYDDDNMYAVFVAFDTDPAAVRANLSRRDQVSDDDIVEIMLDTFHDQRRAYAFVVNPLGVQWDALWTEGQGFDDSWDTLWRTEGQLTEHGYVVSITIPFRSLRFSALADQRWGMLLLREIPRNNEQAFWPHVSTRIEGRLNQASTIHGLSGISPGRNIQFIPYVTSRTFRLLDEGAPQGPAFVDDTMDADGGVDAKLVLNDNLALDGTVNPDFSQVESDNPQVTVNQRFEVFFPEKRPFFLENASYFQTPIDLLFTRRISDPQVGGRLTGKQGAYAVGALLIDDEAPGKVVSPDDGRYNKHAVNAAVRLNRDMGSQSTLGIMGTLREFEGAENRVASVDGRLRIGDTWNIPFQAATSWTRDADGAELSGPAYNVALNREGRHFSTHLHYRDFHPDFRAALGFVERTDIRDLHQNIAYTLRPQGDVLISWGPSIGWQVVEDHGGKRLDWSVSPEIEWELTRQTVLGIGYVLRHERLRPQDFPGLTSDRDYALWIVGGGFESEPVNALGVEFRAEWGRTINFEVPEDELPTPETALEIEAELTLRPTSAFRIDNEYLFAQLTQQNTGDGIFENHILRSRWSLQLSREFSVRAIFQFETVRANAVLTSLENTRNLNTDLLLTYQVNAWTALFAGFNSNFQNLDILPSTDGSRLQRTGSRLRNDSRQFFLKFSYLFRL